MPGERWHKEELEALKWILDRKEERRVEAFRHGAVWEADKWSWDVVAHKMTRVAARDGWPYYRDYTGKVCYTAYRKRKALMADTGPGSSIPTAQEYEQSTASMVHPSQLLDVSDKEAPPFYYLVAIGLAYTIIICSKLQHKEIE